MNRAQFIFSRLEEVRNHDALLELDVIGGPAYFMTAKRFAEEEDYFTLVFDTKDRKARYVLRAHPMYQGLTVSGEFESMEAMQKHEAVMKVFASILKD
jgi:hypothetical protein